MSPSSESRDAARRSLLFFQCPARWPAWPVLAVVRRRPGREEELGVLYDLYGQCGLTGYSATVFFANLYLLPRSLEEFLALPREVFDTCEELIAAGWRVD